MELANTSREFFLDYLRSQTAVLPGSRVLEIGCGEGGNLLPFARQGCRVTGIDICSTRIREAQAFFDECHQQATFFCQDFMQVQAPETESERYDIILVHDVVEHIEPPYKQQFMQHIASFLRRDGVVFFGFPAWQNPFGGHQQISVGLASKLPFIHLLPRSLYRWLLKSSGAAESTIAELMSIRASRMTIEHFERLAAQTDYKVCRRTLWLVNPHYQQKFHLKPRRLYRVFAAIPHLRNVYTTSAWYLLRQR